MKDDACKYIGKSTVVGNYVQDKHLLKPFQVTKCLPKNADKKFTLKSFLYQTVAWTSIRQNMYKEQQERWND